MLYCYVSSVYCISFHFMYVFHFQEAVNMVLIYTPLYIHI